MKILHAVLSHGFYGSERHCIELATAQAQAGHQVAVVIHGGDTPCARAFRDEIAAAQAAIAREGGPGAIRLIVMPRALPPALHRPFSRWTLMRLRPHIVHTHLNPAARRIGRVAQARGIPHVATLHIRYDSRERGGCDGLICVAAWQRATLDAAFRGEAAVVGGWVPAAIHAALARVTPQDIVRLRASWGADDRTIVFGSVGRLMAEKGMDVLIRAFRAAFPRCDEPVRLVMAGDGAQQRELQQLAAGEARIAFIGTQPDIAPLYRALDVYVSAARFEPFGLTILEAMDAGCALVVTRTEGPREFLKDPRVLWAEPGDVKTLAAQLSAAAARGRERMAYDLTPFARAAAVTAIEAFYGAVLARRK
jgi:glycosyltransferase involved in cell wall biosynthesis